MAVSSVIGVFLSIFCLQHCPVQLWHPHLTAHKMNASESGKITENLLSLAKLRSAFIRVDVLSRRKLNIFSGCCHRCRRSSSRVEQPKTKPQILDFCFLKQWRQCAVLSCVGKTPYVSEDNNVKAHDYKHPLLLHNGQKF